MIQDLNKPIFMQKLIKIVKTRLTVLLFDIVMIPVAWYGAYWLRFNLGIIPKEILLHAHQVFPFLFLIQVLAFWSMGLYRGIWSVASLPDLIRIIKAVFIGSMICLLPVYFITHGAIPRSIYPLYAWLLVSLLSGTRLLYRWVKSYRSIFTEGKRVLIVGAGAAGELLLRELIKISNTADSYNPIALVDDDPKKQGCELQGIRVVGLLKDLPKLTRKYSIEKVIIAIPSAPPATIRNIVNMCKEANIAFSTIPKLNDLVAKKISIKTLRDVSIEDLLGREQVKLDWEQISRGISGKKILISGGGGSIGSELCRQIAGLAPSILIVIDNSEFNLYSIDNELRMRFPQLKLIINLVDINDTIALNSIMNKYHPEIVFHAAAYKHVPLLEDQTRSAVLNNVLGTLHMVQAAINHKVTNFVLISTDKAVNPTNVMGATKRMAEIICQSHNNQSTTSFITVRFGNVLGSAGSVVPLFKAQLENGLDLTVTHPEVSRYFMTIPEASQLILQATAIGKSGEILVLDMGEPIKIQFLAEQMIKLSGKVLGKDVSIIYTGLRPGEKLYEELFYSSEKLLPTQHSKILLAKHEYQQLDQLPGLIDQMILACNQGAGEKLKKILFALIGE
jgi:FlaA1/EpsC-like NDP-sugar epimerase